MPLEDMMISVQLPVSMCVVCRRLLMDLTPLCPRCRQAIDANVVYVWGHPKRPPGEPGCFRAYIRINANINLATRIELGVRLGNWIHAHQRDLKAQLPVEWQGELGDGGVADDGTHGG